MASAARASAPPPEGRLLSAGLAGAGLGLRRPLLDDLLALPGGQGPDFVEAAPENWIGVGGRMGRHFRAATERYPLVAHGLSLNLGGPAPLDRGLLDQVAAFLADHRAVLYSEHLAWTGDESQLYDLLPLPLTEEAARYVGQRVARVQEHLGRRIAVEPAAYYATPAPPELSEPAFLAAIIAEADCDVLLDVNNLEVNRINHGTDPHAMMAAVPADRVAYIHIAGHRRERADLAIDSHGAPVAPAVWRLLEAAYERFGPRPTLLERDYDLPPLAELMAEVEAVRGVQAGEGVPVA